MAQTFSLRTRVGFWNIKTMSDSDTLKILEKELKNYKMEFWGLVNEME